MLGKTINDYHIDRFLGHGQFGEVYAASKGKEKFAIKFIRKDFLQKDLQEKVLEREIAALKKVDCEYSVKYFDEGDHVENFVNYKFIVMELVEGETLRDVLQKKTGAWEEKEAVGLITDLLKGLKYIHDADIIHRDLKPENIKVTKVGKLKILDYGLSKIIDYSSITQTGQPIGTYYYMSPEQAKGEKPLLKGSDFYSIGVMLFELLTGQILFYPSSAAEIVYKTVHVKPPYPNTLNPKISNTVENVILKLLEKEAYKRYKSVDEIIVELNKKPEHHKVIEKKNVAFYPRFIQNDTGIAEAFLSKEKIDGADLPINLHALCKNLTKELKKKSKNMDFFADPSTNRLTYSSFRKTQGLKALPYAPTGYDPLSIEDFADVTQIRGFVEEVIGLQVSNGCSVLTAPFFYFDNTSDEWYTINLKLLRESISYVQEKYSQYPISAAMCTQAELLCRKTEREKIINDFANCQTDFLQLYVDKIGENTVDAQIYNYILSATSIRNFNKTKLIACRLPSIGLGLLTVGFHAVTSGLGVLDSFEKGVITKEEENARMATRFYFPDLLKSVTVSAKTKVKEDILAQEATLKADIPKVEFNFTCSCEGCANTTLSDNFQKPRLHFLYQRNTEIKEMNDLSPEKRKEHFFNRIDKAYALQRKLAQNGVKLDSPEYLKTWKEILAKF